MKASVDLLMRCAEKIFTRTFGADPTLRTLGDLMGRYQADPTCYGFNSDGGTFGICFIACAWRYCGFPRVVVGHKLAASLMCTSVPREVAAELEMPWSTWALDVPTNTLCHPVSGRAIDFALLCGDLSGVSIELHSEHPDDEILHISGDSFAELKCARHADAPVVEMASRFALGATVEMMRHRPSPPRQAAPAAVKRKGPRGVPVTDTFVIARDVAVDCRQYVSEYLRGARRSAPKVQQLVRGHWKMQPRGPARSERAMIHIEPYWRGPEDAPIALRAHALGDER